MQLAAKGCFCVVLEHMPASLGKRITSEISVPTVGIGAGPCCDGQVLVIHDMLGILSSQARFQPPFVKRYADLGSAAVPAIRRYAEEVRAGLYPDESHSTA
jgi:3-methyl-2-oxobutanoate hydroxymethyltransferase